MAWDVVKIVDFLKERGWTLEQMLFVETKDSYDLGDMDTRFSIPFKDVKKFGVENRWLNEEEYMTFAELDFEEILEWLDETPSDYYLR